MDLDFLDRELTKDEYASGDVMNGILKHRVQRLTEIDADKSGRKGAILRAYYEDKPWDFCRDWVFTHDPRRIDGPKFVPFIPFNHQVDFMRWAWERYKMREPGIALKSRECGVSWLCVVMGVHLWLFHPGSVVIFGTRREAELDVKGKHGSLFGKMRDLLAYLPKFLLPQDFDDDRDTPMGRILNNDTGSLIVGQSGDQIGRGDRATVAYIDEAAFLEDQDRAAAALSETSECQIRVSTPNGPGDLFHKDYKRWKKHNPKWIFEFHWTKDARKDEEWYESRKARLDPDVVAREIDMSFEGANPDSFLPYNWVESSLDAHKHLNFEAQNPRVMGFDPAHTGGNSKAAVVRAGPVVTLVDAIEGKGQDFHPALDWAFEACRSAFMLRLCV